MLSRFSIPVTLYEEVQTGVDALNHPTVEKYPVIVEGCLVAPIANDAPVTATQLETRHEAYTIAIPKGDAHNWIEKDVIFVLAGNMIRAKTYGSVRVGIEELVPTMWHGQINCERYE